jgi:phage tail sheath protein FI
MLTYCEITRDHGCFAILDPPADQSATGIVTYAGSTAAIVGLSEFGALYWPRVKVLNPSTTVFGNASLLLVPPSGHIAGVYARVDGARPGGVYTPPAGIQNGQLLGVLGFETDDVLDETKRDLVFPKRINPLTVYPGTLRHIDGARTLKADGNFPTVAERRGVIFIEQSLKVGLLPFKHQNNTEALRAAITRTVTAFLLLQLKNGAFASTDPSKAFFVDFGDALNPPSVVNAGQVVGRVGLATAKPAEYIVLSFSQDTRALDAELAGGT